MGSPQNAECPRITRLIGSEVDKPRMSRKAQNLAKIFLVFPKNRLNQLSYGFSSCLFNNGMSFLLLGIFSIKLKLTSYFKPISTG